MLPKHNCTREKNVIKQQKIDRKTPPPIAKEKDLHYDAFFNKLFKRSASPEAISDVAGTGLLLAASLGKKGNELGSVM